MKSGYSKAQMGSQEYREILANLRSLKNLELKKGGDFSRMKERIAKWYKQGLWTKKMVADAVLKGILSKEDYNEITEEVYR